MYKRGKREDFREAVAFLSSRRLKAGWPPERIFGQRMINGKNKQEGQRRSMDAQREELQQATERFIRSMFRTGASLALLPFDRLPREPQQHFQAAGREFTYGLATLVHELAHGLEEMVKDANTSTDLRESSDTNGELE